MKEMFIIRGLPGSGKTTFAKKLAAGYKDAVRYEADMYFEQDGVYKFNPAAVSTAHKFCMNAVLAAMLTGVEAVIVSNTFTQHWEMKPYIEMAKKYGYTVTILTMNGNFGSVHNVPDETVERMKKRWEE